MSSFIWHVSRGSDRSVETQRQRDFCSICLALWWAVFQMFTKLDVTWYFSTIWINPPLGSFFSIFTCWKTIVTNILFPSDFNKPSTGFETICFILHGWIRWEKSRFWWWWFLLSRQEPHKDGWKTLRRLLPRFKLGSMVCLSKINQP